MHWDLRDEIVALLVADMPDETANYFADRIMDLLKRCSADEPAGINAVPEGADH